MWLNLLIGVSAIYSIAVLAAFSMRWRAYSAAHELLLNEDKGRALSVVWAWLDFRAINKLKAYWGEHRFIDIDRYPDHKWKQIFFPHFAIIVLCVLGYQAFLRRGGVFGSGPCPCRPNCSQYFIGCLFRYSFFVAVAQSILRVEACHAGQPVSLDHRFFRQDF